MSPKDDFVHLHSHTNYSMLDGLATHDNLMAEAARIGQPAVAITDHGNMMGAYSFYKAGRKYGVKPIIGIEAYATPGTEPRGERVKIQWGDGGRNDISGGGAYTHLTMLAENNTGMHNLFRISSLASLTGFYRKPRTDRELLSEYSKGIIATTGCPSGEVQTRLRLGQFEEALAAASDYRDIFGENNYFVEIMDHGLGIERQVHRGLFEISKKLQIPLLVTNDLHYVAKGDAKAHEAMLCVQSGSLLSDPNRFKFDAEEFYLKTASEMRGLFPDHPEASDNSLLIAERCEISFNEGADLMPRFPTPEGYNEESWLREEVQRGLERRYPNGVPTTHGEQAEYELNVIINMGFPGYFLVVADYIMWAKEQGIRVGPGRGCLDGDTQIWTPEGRKSLRDISVSDFVFDQNGDVVTPTSVHKYECDEGLTRITTHYGGGEGVVLTNDHKVLVKRQDDENADWVRADSVKVNDLVCVPKMKMYGAHLPLLDQSGVDPSEQVLQPKDSYETGLLLGSWISSGWLQSGNETLVGFGDKRSKNDQHVKNLVKRVFGNNVTFKESGYASTNLSQFTINNPGVYSWFKRIFSTYYNSASTKNIPELLFGLSRKFLTGLRDGLWLSDGSHSEESTYVTTNKVLAEQVAVLLNALGLAAGISTNLKSKEEPISKRLEYVVETSRFFGSLQGQSGEDFDGSYLYYRVTGVEKAISDGFVYDITIPTTASYVADGFIVHNSAAGSLVAYALGITEVDPLEHKLLFERFLNPERVSLPDIDVDFDDTRRGEVIAYVTDKYGADKVAQIITFGIVKAKAALKDSSRILGFPFKKGESLTALVPPPVAGKDMSLHGAFEPDNPRFHEAADLRSIQASDEDAKHIIETALGLEGVTRQWGVHAAGVILSAEPLLDHIPIMKREADGAIITQFDQKTCETLGLLKMDFLGLRNLTVIQEALRLIEITTGETVVLEDLPLSDEETYALLGRGDTVGVFQLDGGPMRSLLRSMEPDNFEDISAVLALYRPGPMGANAHNDYADRKNHRKPTNAIHYELAEPLEEILGDTYGLIVYQEQVMAIAQKLAGYTLGEADIFRRAMGKKDRAELDQQFGKFSAGMQNNNYSEECIKALWEILLPFSDYAFNKAHTAAYGMISYWTAYLKANHTTEYMAALLTSTEGDKDKAAIYLAECARLGVPLLQPDVNESGTHYTPTAEGAIRIGMAAVRNVGVGFVQEILLAREEDTGGRFTSFADFAKRVVCNKRAVDSLIKSGSFDSLHPNRAALASVAPKIIDYYVKARKQQEKMGDDLFSELLNGDSSGDLDIPIPTDIEEWNRSTLLSYERNMLGKYVTDHPLRGYQESVYDNVDGPISEIFPVGSRPRTRGQRAAIGGIVTIVTKKKTRKGDPYVIITLDDMSGTVDISVFPTTYESNPSIWTLDAVLKVTLKVEHREDGSYVLMAQSAMPITLKPDSEDYVPPRVEGTLPQVPTLIVNLENGECTHKMMSTLRSIFEENPGASPIRLRVKTSPQTVETYVLPEELNTDPHLAGIVLRGLLGDDRIQTDMLD